MEQSTYKALVTLLDDPDDDIANNVRAKLIEGGEEVRENLISQIPFDDPLRNLRAKEIVSTIELEQRLKEFKIWKKSKEQDLVKAWIIISKIDNPALVDEDILNTIESMRIDIWLQLNYFLDPFQQVRAINSVFFNKYSFRGNSEDFDHPDNSLIHKVVEYKRGNPLSLCMLYLTLSKKLSIKIRGINLPRHFVLGFFNDDKEEPLFFINVFNGGVVFGKNELNSFLEFLNIEFREDFLKPTNTHSIVLRLINNLMYAYSNLGNAEKIDVLKSLKTVLLDDAV